MWLNRSDTCVLSAPGESLTSKEETNSEPPEDDDIADADLDELSAQDLKTMHLHHWKWFQWTYSYRVAKVRI